MRVCVFHLNSKVASGQVSLPHEWLASMFSDFLYYQVDLIVGDPNMALDRYSSTRQESMDIQGGMYQGLSTPMVGGYLPGLSSSVLTYFLDAWAQSPRCMPFCMPKPQCCLPTAYCSLSSMRTRLASPTETARRSTGIHFLVWTRWSLPFLEWGHSLINDQWASLPADQKEFKASVSEWLHVCQLPLERHGLRRAYSSPGECPRDPLQFWTSEGDES